VRRHPDGSAAEYRPKVDMTRRRPRATLATAVTAVAVLVVSGAGGAERPRPAGVEAPSHSQAAGWPQQPSVTGGAAADGPSDLGTITPTSTRALAAGASPEHPDVATAVAPEGHAIVTGTDEAGAGPTVRFTVEIEQATGIDPAEALEVAEAALLDPRSWARDRHLVRVADPEHADIRLLFATPTTVDRLCGEVGLRTYGVYSCWTGTFATINSWRYAFGAAGFDDLDTYRRYVVNHEVGHGLGFGHVGCPGPGELAPIMMQQSASLGACVANGWPHPD
jgi:hypothetical protein